MVIRSFEICITGGFRSQGGVSGLQCRCCGNRLVQLCERARYQPKFFIDDDEKLIGGIQSDLLILDWSSLKKQWRDQAVDGYVAIPSLEPEQRSPS